MIEEIFAKNPLDRTDEDIRRIIAYLREQRSVTKPPPKKKKASTLDELDI